MTLKPLHQHNCVHCRFLGQHMHSDVYVYDHYFCTNTGSLVARRSSEGPDYISISPSMIEGRIATDAPLLVTHAVWRANLPCPVMIYPNQTDPALRYREPILPPIPMEDRVNARILELAAAIEGCRVKQPDDIEDMYKYHEENFEQRPLYSYVVTYMLPSSGMSTIGTQDVMADNVEAARRQCEADTPGATVIKVEQVFEADFKTEDAASKYIVVAGTIAGGFLFYGPFDEEDVAEAWAEGECEGDDWSVMRVIDPRQHYSDNSKG